MDFATTVDHATAGVDSGDVFTERELLLVAQRQRLLALHPPIVPLTRDAEELAQCPNRIVWVEITNPPIAVAN